MVDKLIVTVAITGGASPASNPYLPKTPQEQVKATLEEMDLLTFYGHVKFDTGESHGLQVAHDMVYVQWQKDADGNLVKEVVWPIEGKSADLLYPLSQ